MNKGFEVFDAKGQYDRHYSARMKDRYRLFLIRALKAYKDKLGQEKDASPLEVTRNCLSYEIGRVDEVMQDLENAPEKFPVGGSK